MNKRGINKALGTLMVVLVGTLLVYSGMKSQLKLSASSSNNLEEMRILKVLDGDTVEIVLNGRKESVRLIGMDTPEIADPRKPVQCFGKEASARAHAILENAVVKIELDELVGERDKYGRMLAYVVLPGGVIYNQQMIAEGYAHEYTYNSQKYKYQAEFKAAQIAAKENSAGFWSENTCSGNTKKAAE